MSKKSPNIAENPEIFITKINLEIRPPNKLKTASSKCTSFLDKCYPRSESAIPLLGLNKDFGRDFKKNRPFSADYVPHSIFINGLQSKNSTADQSIESLESTPEGVLSSSLLLKSLISEPIQNWGTSSKLPPTEMNHSSISINQAPLTPGILSKPPLPKLNKMPMKKINFIDENSIRSLDPIHDYLTLKYQISGENTKKSSENNSEDSSINCINLEETSSIKPITIDNPENQVQIQNWIDTKIDPIKLPNLSEIDIDELFKDEIDRKFDKYFEVRTNIPEVKKKAVKESHHQSSKSKVKFVATPMKSDLDYQEKSQQDEIESWMAKDQKDEVKKNSFLDCLHGLDEIESEFSVDITKELPQRDVDEENVKSSESCEDIASILEALEAEDTRSQMKVKSLQKMIDKEIAPKIIVTDMCDKNENVDISFDNSSIKDQFQKLEEEKLNPSPNYHQLLSFLDEVDKACFRPLGQIQGSLPKTQKVDLKLDTVPRLEDLIHCSAEELSQHVIDLSLRVKDKSSSIALLQTELSELRQQLMEQNKKNSTDVKEKLKAQKDEYESTIKRHQKFIDQLINDKKTLNQKCEDLVKEVKMMEERHQSNLKAMDHKHEVEMKKLRDMHVAGEKIQRERWINNKTEKIKQLTVKSLEPELQNMEKRQQQELTDLRALHKKELEDLELKNARRMQQQLESLRMEMMEEREKCVAHEREIMRQRYESLVESEEKGYQEQRKRLLADHAGRIAECEQREAAAVTERDKAIRQAQEDFDERLHTVIRRHSAEIKLTKESKNLEVETWQTNFMKQQQLKLAQLEGEIRDRCRKDRDREIEKVIETLEHEASENRKQLEQTTENRIKRLKDKYEKEIEDLENSEREYKERLGDMKRQLLESEDLITTLRATIKQLEAQLEDTRANMRKLQDEREHVKEIVKDEMKLEVDVLNKELNGLREARDREIQQLYSRVRVSVARKDEILAELSRDHKALQEKCTYLENMLEQQRKEYFIK